MIKKLVQLYIPALAVLYYSIFGILGITTYSWVLGFLALIALLLGISIFLENKAYDGDIVIINNEDGSKRFSMRLEATPEELELKKVVSFKVSSENK